MAITHDPDPCNCSWHQKMRGRKQSPEHAAKSRAARLGARSSDEHRRKISAALKGRPLSESHRRKMAVINADPALLKQKSEARKARRGDAETHRAVHKRLVCDRGPASDYRCVDCSQPADSWTHAWKTWEDVAQEIGGKRLTFSTNLDAYEPRCHPCHNRLDRNPQAWDAVGSRRGAKLTEADVMWIRTCGLGLSAMAGTLNVSPQTIWKARRGQSWSDL